MIFFTWESFVSALVLQGQEVNMAQMTKAHCPSSEPTAEGKT